MQFIYIIIIWDNFLINDISIEVETTFFNINKWIDKMFNFIIGLTFINEFHIILVNNNSMLLYIH
jgi:hypothetical protein